MSSSSPTANAIFAERTADRITSDQLVEALNALDESPWGDLRGRPLDARGLAKRLRKYDVRPGDHRFVEGTRKGYRIEDFHDAWSRYLPPVADVADVAHPPTGREDAPDVAPPEDEHTYVNSSMEESGRLSFDEEPQQGQQGQHRWSTPVDPDEEEEPW